MLTGEFREQFETLSQRGHAAKDAGEHERALATFTKAGALAKEHDDGLKHIHALTPKARALWSLGRYNEAIEELKTAFFIAEDYNLHDEQGITVSNFGRVAAVKAVRTVAVAQQKATLKATAVPNFEDAYRILKGHPHLYYRYANAQHGSVISALAGKRLLASTLVFEGIRTAFRRSAEPYDQVHTFRINTLGLLQLGAAALLIPFGGRTPVLANIARRKLVR